MSRGVAENARVGNSRDEAGAAQAVADHIIYVVTGHGGLNDRVKKVASLQISGGSIMLVAPNVNGAACETIAVKPYPNPAGILNFMRLPRLKRAIDRLLFFPTSRVLYVKPIEALLRRRMKLDLDNGRRVSLLICVPPHDVCLVGLSLKKRFPQINWVVDWQDLWSFDENYFSRTASAYRPRLLKLEKRVLASCDLNITTNPYAKAVLEDEFHVDSGKVIAIPHHFSSEDLDGQQFTNAQKVTSADSGVIKIGFLGTLFKPPRVPGKWVHEAIREMKASELSVELHVHGGYPKNTSDGTLAGMREDGLIFHGSASHEESLRSLLSYDFLLLLLADLPNSRAVMSIKLPHYMLTGIPIIAIVPDQSAVADVIRQTGTGYVVPIDGDWRHRFKNILLSRAEQPLPRRDLREIERYAWDTVSSEWQTVFARAAAQTLIT